MSDAPTVFTMNDAIIQAVARLVDDAGASREPSHSDLESVFRRTHLMNADPHKDPAVRVGKQKRVRTVLSWACDNSPSDGSAAVTALVAMIRGCGGFRKESPNFCGDDAIGTCIAAFQGEAVELTQDGLLRPRGLGSLSGRELTAALRTYVERASRGIEDSVLVVGTDKDLLEAVAAHVLTERYGSYSEHDDFPTLLGQAFYALLLDAQRPKQDPGGLPGARIAVNVTLYELGCAVNRFRNKAGAGHGRPFIPEISAAEARALTEAVGLIAGRLLDELAAIP
jgi:hypothetical protein